MKGCNYLVLGQVGLGLGSVGIGKVGTRQCQDFVLLGLGKVGAIKGWNYLVLGQVGLGLGSVGTKYGKNQIKENYKE